MNPLKHDVANEEVRGKSRVNAEEEEESLQPSENEKSDQVLSGVTGSTELKSQLAELKHLELSVLFLIWLCSF